MAQQVKDLTWSLLWLGPDSQARNFHMPQGSQKKKNKKERKKERKLQQSRDFWFKKGI